MLNKKIIFIVAILVIILVVAAVASYFYQSKNKKVVSCAMNSDCTLIYSGESECAPCDQSLESYKCAMPDEAAKIREKRKAIVGNIACAPCPPASKNFSCSCANGGCQKVKKSSE
jgi:hypothetical protein